MMSKHLLRDLFIGKGQRNLMLGSSTIMRMNAKQFLKCGSWINRGISSAKIEDLSRYLKLSLSRNEPERILLYAGENDIAKGRPVSKVIGDYKRLINQIRGAYPRAQLHILAIKPSPERSRYWGGFKQVNTAIHTLGDTSATLHTHHAHWRLTPPRETSFFAEDGIHLSPQGYQLFTQEFNEHCKI